MTSGPSTTTPRHGTPSRRHATRSAILPVLVSAALVIPNLIVIALGVEDFPFTTAPMFAHYVGPDTTLYAFRLEGVRAGVAEPLPIQETNLDTREVQRQLASWFYRPMTDTSPFRDVSGASSGPAAFEATMVEFFRPITDFLRDRRALAYDSVDLYVDVVDSSGGLIETKRVGTYDTSAQRYTQVYGDGAAR